MRGVKVRAAAAVLALAWSIFFPGKICAAAVAVEVNGQVIEVDDIELRVRDIHRAKPKMRPSDGGASLSVNDIVDSMVDERLLIQEAADMGLDAGQEFRTRMRAFVRDQSILELYREEVVDRVQVDDAAIRERYVASLGVDLAPGEDMPERIRERIAKTLRKEREKALADAFVAQLRERYEVVVHRERLQAVNLPLPRDVDLRALAEVDGEVVSMADFMSDLGREYAKAERMLQRAGTDAERQEWLEDAKQRVLEALLTNALVGREAMGRDYAGRQDLERAVALRRGAMLLETFRVQVLLPLAQAEDGELREFYGSHSDLYTRGCQVRLGELRFKERDLALAALDELNRGAVFGFLARRLGGSSTLGEGWVSEDRLPLVFRQALADLPEGGISEVLVLGRDHVLLKLRDRRGCTVMPYEEVLLDLRRRVLEQKYAEVRQKYTQALRKRAHIVLHSGVLESLEEAFWKETPEAAAQSERGEP
ncbi:MAG: peptidyl-prolyl cis-trans isomerase [Proteobacteria bacterium]|nr:peptidyl-prolyl cis-trans isomerase [Pseudomonadota bacterium]